MKQKSWTKIFAYFAVVLIGYFTVQSAQAKTPGPEKDPWETPACLEEWKGLEGKYTIEAFDETAGVKSGEVLTIGPLVDHMGYWNEDPTKPIDEHAVKITTSYFTGLFLVGKEYSPGLCEAYELNEQNTKAKKEDQIYPRELLVLSSANTFFVTGLQKTFHKILPAKEGQASSFVTHKYKADGNVVSGSVHDFTPFKLVKISP